MSMLSERGSIPLPNGCNLYWEPNGVGGRTYTSDEVGGGVHVWDTAIVHETTLQAAMNMEACFERQERKRG